MDFDQIYIVLKLSQKIHKKHSYFISQKLAQSDFWQNTQVWYGLFEYLSSKKMGEQQKLLQHHQGLVKRSFGMIGRVFKGSQQQIQTPLPLQEEAIYLLLQEINLYLVNLQITQKIASDIIITLSIENKLDKELLYRLLENQQEKSVKNYRKQYFSSKKIIENLDNKFKKNNLHTKSLKLIFSMKKAIKYSISYLLSLYFQFRYLSPKDKPEQLLLVSKEFNNKLQNFVQKCYFFNTISQEHDRIRYFKVILKLDSNNQNYIVMKNKVQQQKYNSILFSLNICLIIQVGIDMDIDSSIEEIIAQDVQRSFQIHSQKLNSSVLQSILRTYAYFNKDVGYCQGMNYLVGHLLLFFNDEQLTYKAFDNMMQNHFQKVIIKDLDRVKLMFFQFQRLLNIFLPDLAEHFRQQKIETSYFLPQWIITLFSCALQYTSRSALLNIAWDLFLVESWKGFYKFSLFLLSLFRRRIIQMDYEEILHEISSIIRNQIFIINTEQELINYLRQVYQIDKKQIKQQIQEFKVTNRLLNQIEQERNDLIDLFSQRIKEYQI